MRYFLFLLISLPALGTPLRDEIRAAANRFRIDPRLVEAMVEVESAFEPRATSPKGAMGLLQLMPGTADELGVANAYHIKSNLMGACEYLRGLLNRFRFDLPKAIAAYNAGPHNVRKYGGIPPFRETQLYVRRVLAAYGRLKKERND